VTARQGLRSRRVVTPDGVGPATVWMRGGRIEAVDDDPRGAADLGDLVIAPGLVDCHVHVNEPGRTEWEGFATATRAAAAGGVTSLVDMPLNCLPVTTTRAALETKLAAAAGQLFVDVGFWGGVVPGNAGELPGLAAAGALGCKAFLVHSGIDDFPNATEGDLRAAMPVLRRLGLPLLAHAELDLGPAPAPGDPDPRAGDPRAGDPRAYAGYLASRPRSWEDAAIRLLVALCRETGCPVHIVHLSSASSLETLRRARGDGLPITVETCPHYLCLEAEEIPPGATQFKCAPPIRERENRERLWQALGEGIIDFVITDHSPCAPQLKLPERGDFHDAWGGIASLQLGLPAVWGEARRRGAGLRDLAAWMSERPAAFAGLGGRKGRLAPGHDADLVVWDPDAAFTVEAGGLFFRHKVSPYLGRRLEGRVVETWLRGRCIYRDGGHLGQPAGQPLLHRSAA
jgi:allantoinase